MSAIGIDLGTTNSCVSVVQDEKPKVITDSLGNYTTPSVIGLWNENEVYIGTAASAKAHRYPESVVSGVKYNIGKKYSNKTVVKNKMLLNTGNDVLKYNIMREQRQEHYLPEELSAMVLKALKLYADNYLSEDVIKAVITVPTYFNDAQREATMAAGKIAGFKELKLLNESVAAAVAYGVEHKLSDNKIIFVFDFGGGTLDVSILKYTNDEFDVLAIDGDLHLGGDDITNLIFEHIIDLINNPSITNNIRTRLRLLQACEDAKITLSNQDEYSFDICEHDEDIIITRDTFDELTNDLFDKIMSIVKSCLENAELGIDDIYDIVLVGGSSRIPAIQDRLTKLFNKKPMKNINPDQVVAQGAAIVAANWNKSAFVKLKLNTMIAHSVGIELYTEDMSILIPRYSKLPIQKSGDFHPPKKYLTDTTLNLYCGEDTLVATNNTYVGSLEVKNIAIDPISNIRNITVSLEITDDGVLKVSTIDYSKKIDKTTIILDKNNLTETEIKNSFIKLSNLQIK